MKNSFDINQAKTIHSITEAETNVIVDAVRKYKPSSFLDYGCHLGHLSIRLVIEFNMCVYAVDNFTGSDGDPKMKNTIDKLTNGDGNFRYNLLRNIEEAEDLIGFKGEISIFYPDDFFTFKPPIDFAFIDSSHDSHEEFINIDKMIPSGGIMSGHDYNDNYERNKGVLKGVSMIEENYKWIRKDKLFIMQKKWS